LSGDGAFTIKKAGVCYEFSSVSSECKAGAVLNANSPDTVPLWARHPQFDCRNSIAAIRLLDLFPKSPNTYPYGIVEPLFWWFGIGGSHGAFGYIGGV
jgi:hypothetical protein